MVYLHVIDADLLKISKFNCRISGGEKVSDYDMKLMDLDTEHLGIPVSNALWTELPPISIKQTLNLYIIVYAWAPYYDVITSVSLHCVGNRLQLCY